MLERPTLLRNAPQLLFVVLLLCSASGVLSPAFALGFGLLFGLTIRHPYPGHSRKLARFLLQAAVVALGFGMNLEEVLRAGRSGFSYSALGITFAMAVGLLLGRLLRVEKTASFLITVGTAVCGGSAIAAIAPILEAGQEEIAVSMGTVFILNSVALLLFPAIGWALHLTQEQFGLWAALGIHDTSSVVGAGARYGPVALQVGATVKLARALWIVPLALGTAALKKTKTRVPWPWFILFFCLAALANTYVPLIAPASAILAAIGKRGLTATLFLIGTGISRTTIKEVGLRPFLQGVLLWVAVGGLFLLLIEHRVLSF